MLFVARGTGVGAEAYGAVGMCPGGTGMPAVRLGMPLHVYCWIDTLWMVCIKACPLWFSIILSADVADNVCMQA